MQSLEKLWKSIFISFLEVRKHRDFNLTTTNRRESYLVSEPKKYFLENT